MSEFLLKETFDYIQMLDGFMVVVLVDGGEHWVLHTQIFIHYEFLPDLYNFGEEGTSLLNTVFLPE